MLDSDGLQGPGPTGGATAAFQPGGFTVPWNEPSRTPLPRHLYVHVPLCRSKCAYCSFYSAADSGAISHAELVSGTLEALAGWLVPEVQRVPLQTLYVGGGTPTVLGQELVALVRGLTELIPLAPGAEVTVEANPESLSPSLLRGLVDAGVTRVSIGVQALDDDALRLLGRCHDSREALRRHFPQLPGNDGGFMQSALDTPAGRFLLLDTVQAGAPWGNYCRERQEWLARQLAAAGDLPLYVAMHHPPLALGIPSMDQFALREPEAFWAVIAPHRAHIRHLFFGHLHRPIGGSWRGIPFSCTASPNHQVALDLVTLRGDDVPGCREPAGYAVILIDTDSVVVHHQQLFNGETRFWL